MSLMPLKFFFTFQPYQQVALHHALKKYFSFSILLFFFYFRVEGSKLLLLFTYAPQHVMIERNHKLLFKMSLGACIQALSKLVDDEFEGKMRRREINVKKIFKCY